MTTATDTKGTEFITFTNSMLLHLKEPRVVRDVIFNGVRRSGRTTAIATFLAQLKEEGAFVLYIANSVAAINIVLKQLQKREIIQHHDDDRFLCLIETETNRIMCAVRFIPVLRFPVTLCVMELNAVAEIPGPQVAWPVFLV
jgi:hypothetical protein